MQMITTVSVPYSTLDEQIHMTLLMLNKVNTKEMPIEKYKDFFSVASLERDSLIELYDKYIVGLSINSTFSDKLTVRKPTEGEDDYYNFIRYTVLPQVLYVGKYEVAEFTSKHAELSRFTWKFHTVCFREDDLVLGFLGEN